MKLPWNSKHSAHPSYLVSVLFCGLIAFSTPVLAQDTTDCTKALTDAETAYFSGDFDLTISLLQPCVDAENFTLAQGIRAHALLGRTQFVLGETEDAREAIEGLYRLAPAYQPDSQLPPNFSAFIVGVKDQMLAENRFPGQEVEEVTEPAPEEITIATPEEVEEKTEKPNNARKRKVFLFGGGAALAVAAGAILLSGGSGGGGDTGTTQWPLPPAHP